MGVKIGDKSCSINDWDKLFEKEDPHKKQMRKIMIYFLLGFVVMLIFTYVTGLYDDAFKRSYYTGVWYKDILGSLIYYVLWVLP